MVHGSISEGKTNKVRGRPFTKGHKIRKSNADILAPTRLEACDKGGIIEKPVLKVVRRSKEEIESEHELIDSISFHEGKNEVTIRLYKRSNRMYGIKIFLNGATEIRPSTYVGANPAFGFWNLLKGALK